MQISDLLMMLSFWVLTIKQASAVCDKPFKRALTLALLLKRRELDGAIGLAFASANLGSKGAFQVK